MPRVRKLQTRFTQGEIDPKMIGRVDIDQYYGAAERALNVFPLPQGGFTRRPGLRFVEEIQNQVTRNTGQTITCVNGGTTANANDNDTTTLVTTTNNVSTTDPYVVVHYDLGSAKNIAYIDVQNAYLSAGASASEFKIQVSTDNSAWTTIGAVPMTDEGRNKRYRVNASYRYVRFARIGTTDLGTAKVNLGEMWVWVDSGTLSNSRLIDFVFNTSQTYLLVATDQNIAIYKDGVHQADAYIPHTSSQMSGLNWTQSADTLLLFHESVMPRTLKRIGSDTDWYGDPIDFDYIPKYSFTPGESAPSGTMTPSAVSGNITLTASVGFFISSTLDQYISGNGGRARIVEITSTTVAKAVVEIPFFDTGVLASGAWFYEFGYEDVWSSSRGYPGCGVFHEGRLWMAGSTQRPSTIWGSRVGLFYDFDPGSLLDDDAIDGTLDTGQFNKIINLYSGRTLQIFSTGGEHAVIQNLGEPITPGTFNAKIQTSTGSRTGLRVLEVEGGVLYVQRAGESVQEMVYQDTEQAFISNIVSLLSSHLIITPVDLALRKATSTSDGNYLLVVNSDGTLTVGCISRPQQIASFTPQETEGDFLNAGVDDGEMYFVVARTINGTAVRYLETFDFNYTLDCAEKSTAGVPTTSFSGFDHLTGEDVSVIVDEEDVLDVTVGAGVVSFGELIESVTPFEITIATGQTTNTATISAVDPDKSVIFFHNFTTTHTSTTQREYRPRVELTNATTVSAFRDSSSASHTVTVRGVVVEFTARMVESVQHGTITVASSTTTGTDTITSVDPTRSLIFYLGNTNNTTNGTPGNVVVAVDLTTADTVTATRASAATAALTVGYAVVQFNEAVIESVEARSVTLSTANTSDTDTISSVDTARTLLIYGGVFCNTSTFSVFLYNLQLAGSTAVTLTRTSTATTSRTIKYTVLQFKAGILTALRRGTTALSGATSADTAITSVNTARAFLNFCGFSTNASSVAQVFPTAKLLSSTAVRAEKNTATNASTVSWEVPEFAASSPNADEGIEAGFDYEVRVKDLPVEEERIGTALGRKKNISEINLQLYRTKNIVVQGKRQSFNGFLEEEGNDADSGFTGIKRIKGVRGWDLTGQVTITQDKPLPMTVLAIAKKVKL